MVPLDDAFLTVELCRGLETRLTAPVPLDCAEPTPRSLALHSEMYVGLLSRGWEARLAYFRCPGYLMK